MSELIYMPTYLQQISDNIVLCRLLSILKQ